MSRKIPFLEMFAALSRRADLADAVQGWLIVSAAIDRANREAVITLEGAGGAEEDCWDVNGVFCNAPAYLLEGYDSHRKQLADELVLAQCLGLLSGRTEG